MRVDEGDEETRLVVTVGEVIPDVPVTVEVEFISDTAEGLLREGGGRGEGGERSEGGGGGRGEGGRGMGEGGGEEEGREVEGRGEGGREGDVIYVHTTCVCINFQCMCQLCSWSRCVPEGSGQLHTGGSKVCGGYHYHQF